MIVQQMKRRKNRKKFKIAYLNQANCKKINMLLLELVSLLILIKIIHTNNEIIKVIKNLEKYKNNNKKTIKINILKAKT